MNSTEVFGAIAALPEPQEHGMNAFPVKKSRVTCLVPVLWLVMSAAGAVEPTSVAPTKSVSELSPQQRFHLLDSREPAISAEEAKIPMPVRVTRHLQKLFDAADTGHAGVVTREQLQRSGWGMMARHFDEIDVHNTGAVSFADIKQYLVLRGARLD